MVLETIYVVRHGFRSNWVVDAETGTYTSNIPTPTGIPSDPSLASYGVEQANELAGHLSKITPPIDIIFSSPFYRCLQTLSPTIAALNTARSSSKQPPLKIHVEPGIGEFYGLARFDHPSPASNDVLATHFSTLHPSYKPTIRPSINGESIPTLHDRIAYCLHRVIGALDADPNGPKSMLICTHAASMICIGRVLTGRMPEDHGEEDFRCFTCSVSKFERRGKGKGVDEGQMGEWDEKAPETIPEVAWRDGKGVRGGWNCVVNGDCSFLRQGEERGWRFSGDESFLKDPNAYNDTVNEKASEGEGTVRKEPVKL